MKAQDVQEYLTKASTVRKSKLHQSMTVDANKRLNPTTETTDLSDMCITNFHL
jgi:hypothetical protein